MKNLTPSGYQGFPSLFLGLFGGVAVLFQRLLPAAGIARTKEPNRPEFSGEEHRASG